MKKSHKILLGKLQQYICSLSLVEKELEAFSLINNYSVSSLIRIIAINRVSKNSGKTAGNDKVILINDRDKLNIYEATNVSNLTNIKKSTIRYTQIPKSNGKTRTLGISNIIDRVLQTQLCLLLDAYYEAKYPPTMFGFRRGRNSLQAIGLLKSVLERANYHNLGILSLDIEDCFNNVLHTSIFKYFAVPSR